MINFCPVVFSIRMIDHAFCWIHGSHQRQVARQREEAAQLRVKVMQDQPTVVNLQEISCCILRSQDGYNGWKYQAVFFGDEPPRLTYHVGSCCFVLRSRHPTVHQNTNRQVFPKNGRQICMVILFPRRVLCQSTQRCCFWAGMCRFHFTGGFTWSNPLKITWILDDMGSSNKEVKM